MCVITPTFSFGQKLIKSGVIVRNGKPLALFLSLSCRFHVKFRTSQQIADKRDNNNHLFLSFDWKIKWLKKKEKLKKDESFSFYMLCLLRLSVSMALHCFFLRKYEHFLVSGAVAYLLWTTVADFQIHVRIKISNADFRDRKNPPSPEKMLTLC